MLADLIARGGPVMYILLGCSAVSLAIILERGSFWLFELRRVRNAELRQLLRADSDQDDLLSLRAPFIKKVVAHVEAKEIEPAAKLLRRESERAYERSIKYLSGLDTVVSIAPLLGILGTVLGIMKSFHALDFQHMTSPGQVGHGLAEAMITTASGLAIAVPTLVFYNLFNSLAARHAATLYKLSEDLSDTEGALSAESIS